MKARVLLLAVMCSCSGEIIAPGSVIDPIDPGKGGGNAEGPVTFTCTPGTKASPTPLRRLAARQYRNTLRDLFAGINGFDAPAVAAPGLAKLPVDEVVLSFSGIDTRVSETHFDAWYEVSDALASAVIASDAALRGVAGSCALQATATNACIDGFLDGFAARAYRRPLETDERTRYRGLNDGTRPGRELYRALVFSVLMAPQVLYQVEVNGAETNGVLRLSADELAARLALHFWQSVPDAELSAAARSGALLDDAEYERQLARIAADPRTEATVSRFYGEWFELGRLTQFPTTAPFTAFARGTTIGTAGADHLAAADAEIDALTKHFTWRAGGNLRDLLLTDLSFTRSTHLAGLYGADVWDGTSAQPKLPAERTGILTRMAFLVSGSYTTHPIHRGATVRRRLLCEELEAPPPAALPPGSLVPPPPDPSQTTRQRFENKVLNEPCASCHRQMNPIGYVLEQYDAIGRYRTEERIFDDVSGAQLNVLPVSSVAKPQIRRTDDGELSTGPELSQKVADSGKVEACFARQYFRFTHRRFETPADSCALERVRLAVSGGTGTLKAAFIDIARDESFRTRTLEQQP